MGEGPGPFRRLRLEASQMQLFAGDLPGPRDASTAESRAPGGA